MRVSAQVKNTGSRAGDEVVQLYLHALDPKRPRALKELRGIARVRLQPGETRTVTFTFTPANDLRHYDAERHQYAVDAGAYEVQLGASSADIRLMQRITVDAATNLPGAALSQYGSAHDTQVLTSASPSPRCERTDLPLHSAVAMNDTSEILSVREKIGYSLGDLAANLIFQTLIAFLAFFYTDVYRIPAGTAATIIFAGGMLGAFVFTPIVGILADRTSTRWGKFRPWILFTAVPFGVFSLMAFSTPDLEGAGEDRVRDGDLHAAGDDLCGQQPALLGAQRRADRQHGPAQQPVVLPLRRGDGGPVRHPGAAAAAGVDPR